MRKFVAITLGSMFFIAVGVVALPMIFIAANSASASPCGVTATGQVILGSGKASDAYFATPGLGQTTARQENAKKIIAIGNQRMETAYSIQTALEASLQESGLLNLTSGPGTRLGLFQMEPGVKWGTPTEVLDITHETSAFFTALDAVTDKDQLSHKEAALKALGESVNAYATWHWDDIGTDLVGGVTEKCEVHLPLDPGYHVPKGGAFDDPRYGMLIGSKPHKGLDLVYSSNTLGRPVYSAFSGVVVQSGYGHGCSSSSDNVVAILSKDGLIAGYLHMNGSQILVQKGDVVTAGQRIGSIGACGQVTGPHLHFEFSPGSDHDAWLGSITSVKKYGGTWLDPVAVMAHYGVTLLP